MIPKTRSTLFTQTIVVFLILTLSVTSLWRPGTALAQGPQGDRGEENGPIGTVLTGGPTGPLFRTYQDALDTFDAQRSGELITVVVVLEEPAVLETALNGRYVLAQRLQSARVRAAQGSVLNAMDAEDVEYDVLFSTSYVLNGLVVQIPRSDLEILNSLPGVARAYEDQMGVFDNATSVPFIGAPQAWQAGYTGAGIKVGIIDSGVDYLHADFGCTLPDSGPKYRGGYDFVGDSWVPGGIFVPDPDPMDQNGHGTHVAGTAVGCGVTGTGAPYDGPYDMTNPVMSDLAIGPGVAPDAELYALKVGSTGDQASEAAAVAALEWAVTNDLDVVNLSFGRDFGHPDDAWTIASNNAARAGVIVVSSAGNAGNTFYIQGSPSNADWAISVAASTDAGGYGLRVNSPPTIAGIYPIGLADFAPAVYSVTADLVRVDDGVGTLDDACQTPFANAAAVAGRIALIQRGGCSFVIKAVNAQANGAAGVVIYNNAAGDPPAMTGTPTVPITIPVVSVTDVAGASFIAALGSAPPVNVTLSSSIVSSTQADVLTSFTSRGPQRGSAPDSIGLKPDISAPGQNILSALLGSGSGGKVQGGTSMAAPHVAGTMALLRQKHPAWSVSDLKALVMNTALHDLTDGGIPADPGRAGVGRVDANAATVSEVIAYSTTRPEQVSVSFGVVNVAGAMSTSRSITLRNLGAVDATYDVSLVTLRDINGVSYSVTPSRVTVPAGGSAQVTVTLNAANPNSWVQPHTRPANIPGTQTSGYYRQWMDEESGYVQFTLTGNTPGTDLRVAVYAAPRPVGTLQVVDNPVVTAGVTGTASTALGGTGVYTGNAYPRDIVGLVSAVELQYTSPDDGSSLGFSNAADLRYVGVGTDYVARGNNLSNTAVLFGLATYGEWDTLATDTTTFYVYIDSQTGNDPTTPPDGVFDYRIENTDLGTTLPEDTFYSVMWNLSTGSGSVLYPVNYWRPDRFATYPYNSDVLLLAAWGPWLGLTSGSARFDYFVTTYHNGEMVDVTPTLSYDVERQAMDVSRYTGGSLMFYDWPGYTVDVDYNWANYTGPNPPCLLLLHHHNQPGLRPEPVCFATNILYDLAVTKRIDNLLVPAGETPYAPEGTIVVFTITASNQDLVDVPYARVSDLLPDGLTLVSSLASQGTYDPISGVWEIGPLAAAGSPGDSATLILTVQVDTGTTGQTITNRASIEASVGTDRAPGNNTASASLIVGDPGSAGYTSFPPVTTLPATGYPPDKDLPDMTGIWLAFAAALAGVALLVIWMSRRPTI